MNSTDTIPWSDAMLTGVADIDRQHRILVDTLNEAKARLSDKADDPLFDQLTRDLLAYAIYHFDTEEQLMLQHGYRQASPEQEAHHLTQHRHFSERVVALRAAASDGETDTRDALISFLTDWLINHILTTDRRLGEFLRSAGAG